MAEEGTSTTQLSLEYAPSGRASCKANKRCTFYSPEMDKKGAPCEKGKVRVSKTAEAMEGMVISSYYHPECFFGVIVPAARSWTVEDPTVIPGFDTLQAADQATIKKIFSASKAPAAKAPAAEDHGEPKKSTSKKRKSADTAAAAAQEDDREYVPMPEKKGKKSKKQKAAAEDE